MVDLLTPDGCQDRVASWAREPDQCCAILPCPDPCAVACDMVNLLPCGPMWDRQKEQALEWLRGFNNAPFDLCKPLIECEPPPCPSLAMFAVFMSRFVSSAINDTLWAYQRESNPFTAVTSLEQWKDRLGYQDCFRAACRPNFQDTPSPFEYDGLYCPPELPPEYWCALDHATVVALARMRVDGIHNLCYLNYVIEPFGAKIEPTCRCVPGLDGPCIQEDCCDIAFKVCPTSCTLTPCPPLTCLDTSAEATPVPACVNWECVKPVGRNVPDIIWPGVIMAQCFLRSFLPDCPSIVYQCPTNDEDLPDGCECLVLTEQIYGDDELPGCVPRQRPLSNLCGVVEP